MTVLILHYQYLVRLADVLTSNTSIHAYAASKTTFDYQKAFSFKLAARGAIYSASYLSCSDC